MVAKALIVLCHGESQAQNIASWRPEWVQGLSVVVVLDNASPFSGAFPMAQIGPSSIPGFRAGANRDKGLAWAMKHCPADAYLFLDGDCVPNSTWQRPHAQLASKVPTITCGARTESGNPDPRTIGLQWRGESYEPSIVQHPGGWKHPHMRDILAHRTLWSCNFGINAEAAAMLQEAGRKVHGEPRIFYPGFDGRWGGEDTGLAILAYLSGIRILINGQSPVEHIPHAPGAVTTKNLDRVHAYAELCAEKLGKSLSFN